MGRILITHLQDVSLRSLLLATLAAAILWSLRRRPNAAASHAVWSTVLAGMLLLFAAGPLLPVIRLHILADPSPSAGAALSPWREAAFVVYTAVASAMLFRVAWGCWLIRGLVRSSAPVGTASLYESSAIVVPITVGWIRPRILLPTGWREWDRQKLETVLEHEQQHVRRRDSLVALLAATNRSLFWFHPLAWWIERKLALLAEQACDDACVRALGNRDLYARLLLEMASAVEASHGRLIRDALSMAKPSHMRRRIESILDPRRRPARSLTAATWAGVVACSIPVIYATAAVRLEPRPGLLALPMRVFAPPPPPTVAIAVPRAPVVSHSAPSAESLIAAAVQRAPDPRRRLDLLNLWKAKYPHSPFERERLQLYLNTYSQLNDVPNLLAALNQMGREASVKALQINPGRAEAYFSSAARSQTLFYYARAATYEGPGSLAVADRQQLDEFLRKVYSSYYGQNEVGLNELKNLAKSMPFPPQAFLISVLPPPNRTYVASLSAASSSVHIRNNCPYGLRIDCSGPERKRTWIPSGSDSQLVLASGTYEIYAADAQGVSSFTGPGRFDPQFKYDYTLSLVR